MFSLQSRHYIVALIFLFICRNVDLFRGSKGTKNIDLSEFHAKPSPSWSFGRLAKCTWVFHVPSERRDSGWPCLAGGGSGLMPRQARQMLARGERRGSWRKRSGRHRAWDSNFPGGGGREGVCSMCGKRRSFSI